MGDAERGGAPATRREAREQTAAQAAAAAEASATAVNAAAIASGGAPAAGAWTRNLIDRIPTGWSAAVLAGIALAATAVFGGLADAPEPAAVVEGVAVGDEHVNDALAITVRRGVLIDELPGSGSYPEDGTDERVLALVVDVESRWDRPMDAGRMLAQTVIAPPAELDEFDTDAAMSVVRLDDETLGPVLQPRVPATLVLSWTVPGSRYADGDDLEVVLRDPELFQYTLFEGEDEWDDFAPSATVSVTVEDVGEGAS